MKNQGQFGIRESDIGGSGGFDGLKFLPAAQALAEN